MDAKQIPTREEFVLQGHSAELYDNFVAELQERLAADVMAEAEKRAGAVKKIRVKGGAGKWRTGQTHYVIPSEAPVDRRIPFLERPKHTGAPGLRLPIGLVSAVPIRDERHLDCLRGDPNLEFLPDETPSHEDEKRELAKAQAAAAQKAKDAKAEQEKQAAESAKKMQAEALAKVKADAGAPKPAAKPVPVAKPEPKAAEADDDDVPPSERKSKA